MHIFVNRRVAAVAAAALLGLLAALPAAPASASGGSATYTASWLPSSEVEQLLGQLPLSSLPIGGGSGAISPEALIEALEALPAFDGLNTEDLEALQSTIEGLGSGATLEILNNPGSLTSGLEATLKNLLGGLGKLLGGGNSAEEITGELEKALKGVNVEELLSQLLGSSQSPTALLEELLTLLPSTGLEQILGGSLGGSPVSTKTLEELANELGETSEELAKELETSGEALTTELSNGEVLTVLNGTGKLVIGTLDKILGGLPGGNEGTKEETNKEKETSKEETGKETETNKEKEEKEQESKEKESKEKEAKEKEIVTEKEVKEKETSGNDTGNGSGAGGTQVTVNLPPTGTSAAVSKAKKKTLGKIVVLKHSVHAGVATIMVRVPGAGRVTAHNGDIRTVNRRVGRARKLTFAVELSKAGVASLTHGKHAHSLRLRIVFRPTHGLRSHAILKLRFR
ncbi:MAG TPA: hypothetical protein VGF95_01340 [Solirubrobacteraceae bacterium]|jgi:outer membrane biosynthesis protein TonB